MASPATPHDDSTAWALRYAGLGLRVVPIKPGHKRPELPAWQDAATTDRAVIESWWSGLYRGHGVGLALGELEDYSTATTYVFAVDVDQHGVDGEAMLAELVAGHGALPDTVEAITGGGGRHLLFATDQPIRNGQLCAGVDIRGAGGQIVVEPSIHPSGQPYSWVDGHAPGEHDIATAPAWLIDRLTATPEPTASAERPASLDVGDRPGDLWAASITWHDLLTRDGWTHAGRGPDGEDRWTRPGKEVREGISATTNYKGADTLKVFTSSVPHLRAEETYSKIGYLAARDHHGDIGAAAAELRRQGFGVERERDDLAGLEVVPTVAAADGHHDISEGWPIAGPDQIALVLSGDYQPPTPELLMRSDGNGLLYRGRVHSLAGEPGGGKTWVALWAVVEQIEAGHDAVFVDFEDRIDTAVRRLRALGASDRAILDHFTYVTPTFAIKGGHVPSNVLDRSAGATLAVIDSVGEALSHSELDQNIDTDVRQWMAATARRLADGGAAVLLLDHVTKDSEHRGRWSIGSQRKLAAIDGAAYMIDTRQALDRDTEGLATIRCSKDRQGNYAHGSTVADIRLTPRGDDVVVRLDAPARDVDGVPLLTGYMEKISRYLEDVGDGGANTRSIKRDVEGTDKHIGTALGQLVDGGFVVVEEGPNRSLIHRLERPFRDLDDLATPSRGGAADARRHAASRTAQTPSSGRGGAAGSLDPPRPHHSDGSASPTQEVARRGGSTADLPDPISADHETPEPSPVDNSPAPDPNWI